MTYSYGAALAAGRNRNRVFEVVVKAIVAACQDKGMSRKDLADKIGRKPAQLSKWLSGPSNWTLDTVSDLLYSIDAEIDCEVIFNESRRKSNSYNNNIGMLHDQQLFLDTYSPMNRSPIQNMVQVLHLETSMVD